MNLILFDIRSRLLMPNVSSLMFIKLHDPPLTMWDPNDYIKHGCDLTDVLATHRFALLVKSLQ